MDLNGSQKGTICKLITDNVREQFGLEHTQAVLGHSKANMTEHYAKASRAKAAEVARKIG